MATSTFILLDDQMVTALVSYVDDEGNPATAPAGVVPAWSAADPDGTLCAGSQCRRQLLRNQGDGQAYGDAGRAGLGGGGNAQRKCADPGERQRGGVARDRAGYAGACVRG